jgi:RNA polymerase sigma-70 factor (ECF subfamily)
MKAIAASQPDHSVVSLVDACRNGEAGAFERLFERYRDYVHAVAIRALGCDALAADVTQDVFLKLLTRIRQYRGDSAFETWLYRITVNTAADARRASRRTVPVDDLPGAALANRTTPEDEAARSEAAARVREGVAALAPKLRAPVVLRYGDGLAYDEIAEALAISPGTVASRLNRAHRELAARLAPARARRAIPTAIALALVALAGLAALRLTATGPVLRHEAAASPFEAAARTLHVALATGETALDLATDSPAEVRRWLEEREGISASLADVRPGVDGDRYVLEGVKAVEVDGVRAGAIVYRVDGRKVTLLVARDRDVPDAPRWGLVGGKHVDVRRDPATGLTTLTWRNSGNAYTLVSDLPDAGRASCFVCHTTEERRRQILAAPVELE